MQRFVVTLALVVVLCGALCAAVDKDAAMAKFMDAANACVVEVGATKSDIDEIIQKQAASNYAGKCLRFCVMKKLGFMGENGKLDTVQGLEKAKMYIEDDAAKLKIAEEIASTCAAISVPADHCESAELYGSCFHDEAVKHGLKIH